MTRCRCLPDEALVALVALVVGWVGLAAAAQQTANQIPPDLISSTSLDDAQKNTIEDYVGQWATRLTIGEDADVAEARRQLLQPLGLGSASEPFLEFYSQTVSQKLTPAIGHERLVVRLNAFIVAARLRGEAVFTLIGQGLKDASPAVRYWAAKAAHNAIEAGGLNNDAQLRTLGLLTQRLDQEDAALVVRMILLAIAKLNVPAATDALLESLNTRITLHASADPAQALVAEQAALQQLYQKLITAGSNPSAHEALRRLARTAVRYMDLAAAQLDAGRVSAEARDGHVQMITLAEAVLIYTRNVLGSPRAAPNSVAAPVRVGDWKAVRAIADHWRSVLREPPFDFSDSDLKLVPDAES